nr:RNA-directed DNA polymerase, eukaryota [Tanacetum cinerariifolium]
FQRTSVNEGKKVLNEAGGFKNDNRWWGYGVDLLGDECLVSKDLSKSLLGRVNEFASLANLKRALIIEGFVDISIQYMGELWAMLEFGNEESIILFRDNNKTFKRIAAKWGNLLDVDGQEETCYHSKRLCIHMKNKRSIVEEFKIIHRGKIYWIRANETPGWVPDFSDESNDEEHEEEGSKDEGDYDHVPGCVGDDMDGEEVLEMVFEEDGQVKTNLEKEYLDGNKEKSEDPFNLYPFLNKGNLTGKDYMSDSSLKYPPGFTPQGTDGNAIHVEGDINDKDVNQSSDKMDGVDDVFSVNSSKVKSKGDSAESTHFGHFKMFGIPRTEGSILGILDDVVKVGQVMGYKMDGCLAQKAKKDWVKELCIKNKVNFLTLQETKMENMDLVCMRTCWGNMAFDYVHSNYVGNSGGILCVWDPNSFCKKNVTISDYFIMVRGVWHMTGQNFLLITVYAPHDGSEKKMLWEYLQREIGSGEDRFLVSESLLSTCPNINATTLEGYISDHQPILVCEAYFDYGPTPFWFFHYWIEMDGFCNTVEDACKESPCVGNNAMQRLMSKLKYLKNRIRDGQKTNRSSMNNVKAQYKSDLVALDLRVDKGNGTVEDGIKKVEIINKILDCDKLNSIEVAQKAKVKWAVEGDENSSFFHGVLNKMRNLLNIRGIINDGIWIDNPKRVKGEFLDHFSKRFCEPENRTASIMMDFLKRLSFDQQIDLERDVTNDEIKMAVWDCGMDKAPGPDGFTFGFYRHFWYLIDKDVYEDFRPISLVGSLYKIIAKILANRLVGVLGDIVSEVQYVFIAGRQILYGPLILNEVLHWCKTKQKQALIFKVDFEKAYDSVRWDFLDDILFFVGQWCESNITTLVHVLGCFHRVSGLKINMCKSKIMGVHVKSDNVKTDALKLGCLVLKRPFVYLGSIMGRVMSRTNAWSEIVERVKKRLSKWKMKTLSIGVNSKKASWVNWKKVLTSKDSGGLGVSSLYALNRGLMFKWIWRFYTQESSLWVRIIKAIHGADGINLMNYMHVKLGDGIKTAFWEDAWSEGGKLKHRGAKRDQFEELMELVNAVSLAPVADRWKWDLESSGDFLVASVRTTIDDKILPASDYKTSWIKYVPIKINIHAWKVMSNALPTRFNISRRGICINNIKYAICHEGVETVSHLLFSCEMVRQVTHLITCWWSVNEVAVQSYDGWLDWFASLRLPATNKQMFEGVFYVMWWLLWTFRNKLIC